MKTAKNIFTELKAGMTTTQTINASSNPDYPVGLEGDKYKITVPGKVGGLNGKTVNQNDIIYCTENSPLPGNEAIVGKNWALIPAKAVEFFNGK